MPARLRWMPRFSALLALVGLVACGEPPPAVTPPPPPAAKAEPPPPAPAAEPTATGEAKTPPPEDTSSKSSGRTPVLKSASEEITDTFGSSPPAKLEIGEAERATLRIPENALSGGVNITFKLDKKGKSTGTPVGKIYRITPIVPPASAPSKIESAGPPFEMALPAGAKKDANLAIGEITTDDKGREKIVWTVIAPKKIDDGTNMAHFELPFIADAYFHVTTKPATAPPPAAP